MEENTVVNHAIHLLAFLAVLSLISCGSGGGSSSEGPKVPTFTMSGTLLAAAGTAVDSDLNDPLAPFTSNDTFETAQSLPDQARLGGYVNVPSKGMQGRSFLQGDRSDCFIATLAKDQVLNLHLAEPAEADLDLLLYDALRNLVDASKGTGAVESLTITSGGIHYIEVLAEEGASSYTLTMDQSAAGSSTDILRLSAEFVPGEAVVCYKGGRDLLVELDSPRKMDTLDAVKALRKRPDVLYAEPNYIRRAFVVPNDEKYFHQWHYPLINLPQAWDLTTGNSGVVVAVIDTGVLMNHPDLAGQLTADGYDFISNPATALDGDGIDPNPDDPGDQSPGGSDFHGTHVSGTIGAATNQPNQLGVAAVAWNTRIMPLRVLGKGGGGTTFDMLQAIRYAAGMANNSGTLPSKKADVINLSLGGIGFSQAEQNVITQARNNGVVIVAAAGNDSTSAKFYPASYEGVVSVSAVNLKSQPAYYSNFGQKIDVAAPGGDLTKDLDKNGKPDGVMSTYGNDAAGPVSFTYKRLMGTSMAAPHVAGVVALMKAVHPLLSPPDVDALLTSGDITTDLGDPGWDERYGHGLIDAYKAVLKAHDLSGGGSLPTVLFLTPASINLGTTDIAALLTAQKSGTQSLSMIDVTVDANWLTVVPTSVDSDGLGLYTAFVDRTGLAFGSHLAKVTFTSTENTVEIPAIAQVGSHTGNAGYQYVMLVDPSTYDTVRQVEATAFNGSYAFAFTGVIEGEYRIFCGTDLDNDQAVGDAGEALGAYLTLQVPITVTVDKDIKGLVFYADFNPGATLPLKR